MAELNEQLLLFGVNQMADPEVYEEISDDQYGDSSTVGFALLAIMEHRRKYPSPEPLPPAA